MAEVKSEKIELKFVNVIIDRDLAEKVIHSLEKLNANAIHVFYGSGTAPNELLAILGVMPQKAIITFTVLSKNLRAVYECLKSEFHFDQKGKGIAFTLPIVSTSGLASLKILTEN